MPRLSSANPVEALLDGGEAVVDERLELGIGENVGPVVLDCLANQFADIERIDTVADPLADHLDAFGNRPFRWWTLDGTRVALREIAPGGHDSRANEARAQDRHAD